MAFPSIICYLMVFVDGKTIRATVADAIRRPVGLAFSPFPKTPVLE
jgi:hypothetical protein